MFQPQSNTNPFRNFGGRPPTAEEVRVELESVYNRRTEREGLTGMPGNDRPRRRQITNIEDSRPPTSFPAQDTYVPRGQIGRQSREGGTYLIGFDGTRRFYQAVAPSEGKEGDLWYDTSNNFRVYIFQGGKWVDVFADVPSIAPTILGLDSRAYMAALDTQVDNLLRERQDRNAAIVEAVSITNSLNESAVRRITALNAQVNDPSTGLATTFARITTEELVRATADGNAIASVVNALTAGSGGATITGGQLIIGATYKITANTGSDFTNVGAANNLINTVFVATGTTPTAWGTGALQETRLASVETWSSARVSGENSLKAEYVLNVTTGGVSGRRVAGFRITNLGGAGGATEFVVQTDKFVIVDTSGNIPTVPFKVTGGYVYIDKAVITEVNAGSILAGTIAVAIELTAATVTAGLLRSGSGVTFSANTGYFLGNDGGVQKFRVGTASGERISFDGTNVVINSANATISGGTVTIGSGDNKITVNTNGLYSGDPGSGSYVRLSQYSSGNAGVLFYNSSGSLKGFAALSGGALVISAEAGSTTSALQNFGIISGLKIQGNGTSSGSDSSFYGKHAFFENTLRVDGTVDFNSAVDIAGALALHSELQQAGLNVNPDSANTCDILSGEVTGTTATYTKWMKLKLNGRTVYTPFSESAPT